MTPPPPMPPTRHTTTARAARPAPRGMGGWLLLLCLMLVLVCPVLVAWLATTTYAGLDSRLLASGPAHGAVVVSLWLAGVSAALGVRAGLALWSLRAGAVGVARRALLLALALDVAATALQLLATTITTSTTFQPGLALDQLLVRLLPDLLFFTLCLGYLNKSSRVALTYPADPTAA